MIRTKDGRDRVWTFVASALGTQSDGRHVYVTVAQDVTERRAHEQQVQLLLREVNHRAKNMLSLVHAIARQTASREPEDFIGRFSERIQALAANQDLLVQNEWQGVDAGDLVRAQLTPFADLIGSRITLNGPKLRLNAAAAQGIGLALHELVTNASKYGVLLTDRGRADIGCVCTQAPRVRHHSYGSDGGAQRGWCGRPPLSSFGPDLALDLPRSERAGALGTCANQAVGKSN
jgi:two-component sensor histidine kinase